MLTAFYVVVAVCALFVILSLAVVRSHEKHREERAAAPEDTPLPAQEEEFFSSPIYKAMEAVAHL